MKLIWAALLLFGVLAIADAKGVFFAFTGNGFSVIDVQRLQIMKTVPYNTTIPGTQKKMCTPSFRSKTKCSWQGVTTVGGKYIFAADSIGNRIIVIDVAEQRPIKAIKTHAFPYQVTYLESLDEVWILCWRRNILDVVGDGSGTTAIQKISNASSLVIKHSIQAQTVKSYKYISHSYLRAENCQKPDQSLQYGLVSHYNEPGIHKIDLVNKRYDKFINTTDYGCHATFGLAYSSVRKYAFVQCLGNIRGNNESKMLIIDTDSDQVIHHDDSLTNKATGYPYASPDGKFVVVLNPDRIITYFMRNNATKVTRLQDVQPADFYPEKIAFVKNSKGYTAFVTSKNTNTVLVMRLRYRSRQVKTSLIKDVGFGADLSEKAVKSAAKKYKKSYMKVIRKLGKPYVEAEFQKYVKNMIMQHVRRPIAIGCSLKDRYMASPAGLDGKMAVFDGRNSRLLGMVDGVNKVKSVLWVRQQ